MKFLEYAYLRLLNYINVAFHYITIQRKNYRFITLIT